MARIGRETVEMYRHLEHCPSKVLTALVLFAHMTINNELVLTDISVNPIKHIATMFPTVYILS